MTAKVDSKTLSSVTLILKEWPYLPYLQYFSTKDDCAKAYLAQFKEIGEERLEENGALFVAAKNQWLAGLRRIAGESESLGLKMARLEPLIFNEPSFDRSTILEGARFLRDFLDRATDTEHIAAPISSADTFSQLVLQECGFKLADTIVCHHIDLEKITAAAPNKHIRQATPADADAVAEIAERDFSDRSLSLNRFLSDPNFNPELVGKMYAKWTRAAILNQDCDANLVFDDGEISGFYTFRLPHHRGADAEIGLAMAVLSAVDPKHSKRGVFSSLQEAGCQWLKEHGAKLVEVKTVLPNKPVNRVCQKMNGKVVFTYHTFHRSR